MAASVLPIRHVLTILAVDDPVRAATFYRGVFGWPVQVEVPVFIQLALPDGTGVGLYERHAFAANTGIVPAPVAAGASSATELYFLCDDVDGVIGRLGAHGARELSPLSSRPWGDEVAYFRDPDGNVIAVARSTDHR